MTTTASITKATLTVTAANKAIVFGQPDPAFTFNYGAFANGETAAVIDTPPTCGVAVPERDVAGSPYPSPAPAASTTNYAFTYVAARSPSPRRRRRSPTPRAPDPATSGNTYVPSRRRHEWPRRDVFTIGPTPTTTAPWTARPGDHVPRTGELPASGRTRPGNGNYLGRAAGQQTFDVTAP